MTTVFGKASNAELDRRCFVGGSDACIIMGKDEDCPAAGSGGKNEERSTRWTCLATSSCSSVQ